MTRRNCLLTLGGSIFATAVPKLIATWRKIAAETDGLVGAAALHLDTGERISLYGDERCPLASVGKLPVGMHMLALIDEGRFAMEQPVEVLRRGGTFL